MNPIAGHCGKCGAPYTTPTIWHGITPPPMAPSCMCWNTPQTYTSTSVTIETSPQVSSSEPKECKACNGSITEGHTCLKLDSKVDQKSPGKPGEKESAGNPGKSPEDGVIWLCPICEAQCYKNMKWHHTHSGKTCPVKLIPYVPQTKLNLAITALEEIENLPFKQTYPNTARDMRIIANKALKKIRGE